MYDLMQTSQLSYLLRRFPSPFAHSNGIRLTQRLQLLQTVSPNHGDAKAQLQKKYFGNIDLSIAVFSFVGRIVVQKGVHLILNAVSELIAQYQGRIQFLVGGQANFKDPYAAHCAWTMQALRQQYPSNFWADPTEFFSDGPLVNIGSDFGLVPSLFEPSGVVQQEYFAAGTPVIAFKTGGLKDTIFEFQYANNTNNNGNGFTFEAHAHRDYVQAVTRAMAIFSISDAYNILRKNAFASVLDTSVVSVAWAKEYARLRQRLWAEPKSIEAKVAEIEKEKESEKQKKLE